jgi:cell division septation protein DedD
MPELRMLTPTATPTATSLDRSEESTTTALYRAAIGTVNLDYYLPLFTRFEGKGRAGLSWNGAASLYTLNWMIFRKLQVAALIYAAVLTGTVLLVFGIGRLLFQVSETTEVGLWLLLAILSFVIPGFYGNALLYTASRKKMAQALSATQTLPEACALLHQQASSRTRFIGVALTNGGLLCCAALVYLLVPGGTTSPLTRANKGEIRNLAIGQATDLALPVMPGASAATPTAALPVSAPPMQLAAASLAVALPASLASAPAWAASEPSQPVPAPQPQISAEPAPAKPLPKPLTTASKAAAAQPKASGSKPATQGHFYINVGLFASADNAHNARRKLRIAGLPALAQPLQTKKGLRTRVRVGPFDTQSETDAAVVKIRSLELDAIALRE